MEITQIPFNAFIGLEACGPDEKGILRLPDRSEHSNHLGTVHASALFALAEASSGSYLHSSFPNDSSQAFAVLRSSNIKYRKPSTGQIYSVGRIDEADRENCIKALEKRGKGTVSIEIELLNEIEVLVATCRFDWFLSIEA